jgi:TolB-like protein
LRTNLRYRRILFTALFLASIAAAREKITVAVLDFEPKNVERESAEAITDLLRTELFNTGRFMVVERQKIQKILEEQKFQMSGLTDTDQAAQIGRLLNVKKIMIGTVNRLGGTHIINTRIVDVQSGLVELAEAVESRGGEENLPGAITELALKVSSKAGLEGSIVRIADGTAYIDIGGADGVKPGQQFGVIRAGEAVTDLDGRVIGARNEIMGFLTVSRVEDRFSEAPVKEEETAFRKGDKVRPAEGLEFLESRRGPGKSAQKPKKSLNPSGQEEEKVDVPPTF